MMEIILGCNEGNMPYVTVITIVKNDVHGIEKTIQSVLNQDFKQVQYIVVDGGSTDGTLELIKKYDEVIDVLISENDDGIYNAINKGLSKAKGRLINILNSGDSFTLSNTLSTVVQGYLLLNSRVIYGSAILLDQGVGRFTNRAKKLGGDKLGRYAYNIIHQAMFYERSIHDEVGMYDEKFKVAAEHKFTLDVIYRLKICPKYINSVVVNYRGGGVSSNSKYMYEYKFADNIVVGKTLSHEFYFLLRKISNKFRTIKFIVRWCRGILYAV